MAKKIIFVRFQSIHISRQKEFTGGYTVFYPNQTIIGSKYNTVYSFYETPRIHYTYGTGCDMIYAISLITERYYSGL